MQTEPLTESSYEAQMDALRGQIAEVEARFKPLFNRVSKKYGSDLTEAQRKQQAREYFDLCQRRMNACYGLTTEKARLRVRWQEQQYQERVG